MSEWQPIETAPRDGTPFAARIKHGVYWLEVTARFRNGVLYDTRPESCVGWDPTGDSGKRSENHPMWKPAP